jgi:hypothetical protein
VTSRTITLNDSECREVAAALELMIDHCDAFVAHGLVDSFSVRRQNCQALLRKLRSARSSVGALLARPKKFRRGSGGGQGTEGSRESAGAHLSLGQAGPERPTLPCPCARHDEYLPHQIRGWLHDGHQPQCAQARQQRSFSDWPRCRNSSRVSDALRVGVSVKA